MKYLHSFRKKTLILLVLALPVLIVFGPIIFADQLFADSDTLLQTYPAARFLQSALQNHDSFLWTPQVLSGFPLANSFLGGFFSPVYKLLFSYFDGFSVYNLLTVINFILTAWFTYALGKKLKLSTLASLFAGISISLSTAYWLFGANLTVTSAYWSPPGLLLTTLYLHSCRSISRCIITIIAAGGLLGIILLQAHPQWPLQAMALALIFALILDWKKPQSTDKILRWQSSLGIVFLSIIGITAALPQLLSAWQQGLLSARATGVSLQEATVGALIPGDFTSFIFPNLAIHQIVNKPGFLYVGALGLLLAILSLWSKKNFYYKFFLGTFIVTTVTSIKYSPLFWLIHQLPIFESFREPSRFMYIGLFALVIMAAYGFDFIVLNLLTNRVKKIIRILNRVILAGIGLLILWQLVISVWGNKILAQIIAYFDANLYAQTTALPLEHYHNVITRLFNQIINGTTVAGSEFTIAIFSLLAASGLLVVWSRRKLTQHIFASLLIVLAAANLVGINMARNAFIPKPVVTTPPTYIEELKTRTPTPFRVWAFFPGSSIFQKLDSAYGQQSVANVQLHKALLVPNTGLFYGIDSLDYYDDIMDRRHARLLGYLGSDRSTFGESLATSDISFAEKKQLFLERLDLLAAYNVKYILSLFPLESPQLRKITNTFVTEFDISLYVYEISNVLPRYYLTDKVSILPILNEEESWDYLIKNQTFITSQPYIECDDCSANSTQQIASNNPVAILPTFFDNDEFVFNINLASPQWFIIGHNNLPGWQASINNQLVDIYRANFINQAIYIPEGQHVVRLEYNP